MFFYEGRKFRTFVHGDDYASTGSVDDVEWSKARLEDRFEMKTAIIGHSRRAGVVTEGQDFESYHPCLSGRMGVRVRQETRRGDDLGA